MAKDESTRRDDAAAEEATAGDTPAGGAQASDCGRPGGAGAHHGMQDMRRGIPGKGFDAGTGYGGAGGNSAYSGKSSYGGQAGYGGSYTRGAYAGGKYGRPDDPDGPFAGRGLDAVPPEPEDEQRPANCGPDADRSGSGGGGA